MSRIPQEQRIGFPVGSSFLRPRTNPEVTSDGESHVKRNRTADVGRTG